MLLWLTDWLGQYDSGFYVFRYLTLRAILGVVTALAISLIIGRPLIRWLSAYKVGQTVRDDGPESHFSKAGTPTMGGTLILVAIAISSLLWADLSNRFVWVVLITTMAFGIVGLVDDYKKLVMRDPKGLAGRWKYFWQTLIGLTAALYLYTSATTPSETALLVPYLKDVSIQLGPLLSCLPTLSSSDSSNAVNLTDGLDGLAVLPTVLVAGGLGIMVYAAGNVEIASYLRIPYVSDVGEVVFLCCNRWCRTRLSVVQHLSGPGLHGRCRRTGPGRGSWLHCGGC